MSKFDINNNPYLQSRALWEDIYGSVHDKLKKAYRLQFALIGVVTILTIGLVVVSGRSEIKPYLTVLKGNEVITVHDFDAVEADNLKPKLAEMLAKNFLVQARGVSTDSTVNNANRMKALSVTSGGTTNTLMGYLRNNPPIKNTTRTINVETVLHKSAHSITLRWQEVTTNSHTGKAITNEHYTADLTYEFDSDQLTDIQRHYNPTGFTLTSLSWSKDVMPTRR